MYIVKYNSINLFLNKKYNICYGRCIINFINDPECDIEIVAYKEPSFVHNVAYKNAVSALYNYTKLSDSDEENNALNKIIANVQFGLLEKSYNKQSKSFVFLIPLKNAITIELNTVEELII